MQTIVEMGITAREDGEFDWIVRFSDGKTQYGIGEDFDVALTCVREIVEEQAPNDDQR